MMFGFSAFSSSSSTAMSSASRPPSSSVLRCMTRMTTTTTMMMMMMTTTMLFLPACVDGRAILGIDLGSYYMKVALVQSGSPLEIVTNLHSKRKTEQMILFDGKTNEERFYGADAKALYARKSHVTPVGMSQWLGRDDRHPTIQALSARHSSSPIQPVYDEERAGLVVRIGKATADDADKNRYTPEELVAMVLEHAKTISVAHASSQGHDIPSPGDCVITVPSFATVHERLSVLDAASLANLRVLTLMDENTASALQYAMDKTFDDDDGERMILFYNMGASSLQVSLIRFFSYEHPQKYGKPKRVPSLEVMAKAWDETLGGGTWDEAIVNHLADAFNRAYREARPSSDYDVRTNVRAMTKLAIQANKVKHVLSANTEMPIHMEALHDDVSLSAHMTRSQLEEITADLLKRAVRPVEDVLRQRENLTIANVTAVELVGGGMRVPSVQRALSEKLQALAAEAEAAAKMPPKFNIDLGMHLNSDESMALGSAFGGANISTAFRVRQVGFTDINPFGIQVTLSDVASADDENDDGEKKSSGGFFGFGGGDKKKQEEKDADADAEGKGEGEEKAAEAWTKKTTVFKPFGKLGVKKTIAFTHDRDVHCALDYPADDAGDGESMLPEGTERALERYNITGVSEFARDMRERGLGKPKVSLQFELNAAGLTSLVRAEAAVEETYTVEEEVEIDDDDQEDGKGDANATETTTTTTATDEGTDGGKGESDATATGAEETGDGGSDATTTEDGATDTTNDTAADADANATDKGDAKAKKTRKTKLVEKEKKKTHKKTLKVEVYYTGRVRPHTSELLTKSSDKLMGMAARDAERILLEETRNKLESYIFQIKNKLVDDADEIGRVSTAEQREAVEKLAADTETWMDEEGYKADLATTEERYVELSEPFEKIKFRIAEGAARPIAVEKLQKKLTEVDALLLKWETSMPQITEEERTEVAGQVETIRAWILDREAEQAARAPHEDPAFTSAEVPLQLKDLEKKLLKLSKRPKPKPKKDKKNSTNAADDAAANSTTSGEEEEEDGNATADAKEGAGATGEGGEEGGKEEDADAQGDEETPQDDPTGPGDGGEL